MYQITAVKTVPDACLPYTPTRRTLREGSVSVTVPSIQEDEQIRWLLEHGNSIEDAYKNANAWHIIPDQAMRDCIELVFKEPYFDPVAGVWKTSPGQFTCVGFHKCLQQYARGQAAFPEEQAGKRRMRIARGVFAPSEREESCIQQKFLKQVPLDEAYRQCGAGDIIPFWPGGLQDIATAFMTAMGNQKPFPPIYEILKRSHQLYAIRPPSVSPSVSPAISPPVSPPAKDKEKKPSKLIYFVVGGLVLLLLSES